MCARVVKKRIARAWRRAGEQGSVQPHRRLLLDELNLVFGASNENGQHWRAYEIG